MSSTIESHHPEQDTEIALTSDKLTLYVSPWGASLRGLVFDKVIEIITRYQGADKVGGQGDVLIPFPGRIKDGTFDFNGSTYQLHKNDAEGPNAIHGFLRSRLWEVKDQTEYSVSFVVDLAPTDAEGYPFSLHVEVNYEVNPNGIVVKYSITNTGDSAAPVAAGFHPYFTVGTDVVDDILLLLPFESYLEYENMIPTGRVLPIEESPFNFLQPKVIAKTKFNNCFCSPIRDSEGNVAITLRTPDAYRTTRVILGPEIDYVVLYTGEALSEAHQRKSIAIEPMSCGSDAFNHPAWGLASLAPGETLNGKWSVETAFSDWQGSANPNIVG